MESDNANENVEFPSKGVCCSLMIDDAKEFNDFFT